MSKISIVGVGRVGSAIAYSIAQKELAENIVLIDRNKEKAIAESLDISHSLSQNNVKVRAGDYEDISDSHVVIISAGIGRKTGQSRDDLMLENSKILKSIISGISPFYKNSIVIVVSNPVDIMTHLVSSLLDAEYGKIIGTGTLLDTARLRYELSNNLNKPQNLIDCMVIGEHGNESILLRSSIKFNNQDISEKLNFEQIIENIHKSGDRIIQGKDFTSHGIAFETCNLVKNIIQNSNKILPISISLKGEFDISNVSLSVPCVITNQGVKNTNIPSASEQEIDLFKSSANKMKKLIRQIPRE